MNSSGQIPRGGDFDRHRLRKADVKELACSFPVCLVEISFPDPGCSGLPGAVRRLAWGPRGVVMRSGPVRDSCECSRGSWRSMRPERVLCLLVTALQALALSTACGESTRASESSTPAGAGGSDTTASSSAGIEASASTVSSQSSGSGDSATTTGSTGCREGGRGCPCHGDGLCDAGLTCVSELCVAGGAASGAGGAGAGNGGSGGSGGAGAQGGGSNSGPQYAACALADDLVHVWRFDPEADLCLLIVLTASVDACQLAHAEEALCILAATAFRDSAGCSSQSASGSNVPSRSISGTYSVTPPDDSRYTHDVDLQLSIEFDASALPASVSGQPVSVDLMGCGSRPGCNQCQG